MYILTGGSFVKNGVWRSCDLPLRDPNGIVLPEQSRAEHWLGTFLLAKGLVNQSFGYYRFQDVLVVQSRKFWTEPISDHILKTSIVKLLADYPEESFSFRVPIKKERKDMIKNFVLFALDDTNEDRLIIR